jgi:hypothetical protein
MDLTNVCPRQTIVLAKQGEYGMDISYDYSSWVEKFGSGSVGWTIQRSADPGAYPLVHTEDGNISTVILSETETAYAGRGSLEVFYVNDGETEKRISQNISFYIEPSLQNMAEAPSAWQSYIDMVHRDAEKIANVNATAEINPDPDSPSVEVTKEETDTSLELNFLFKGLIPDIEYDEETAIMTISYAIIA